MIVITFSWPYKYWNNHQSVCNTHWLQEDTTKTFLNGTSSFVSTVFALWSINSILVGIWDLDIPSTLFFSMEGIPNHLENMPKKKQNDKKSWKRNENAKFKGGKKKSQVKKPVESFIESLQKLSLTYGNTLLPKLVKIGYFWPSWVFWWLSSATLWIMA